MSALSETDLAKPALTIEHSMFPRRREHTLATERKVSPQGAAIIQSSLHCVYTATQNIFLRPRFHTLVPLRKLFDLEGTRNYFIPNTLTEEKYNILIPHCVVNDTNPCIWLSNPTKRFVRIKKHVILGAGEESIIACSAVKCTPNQPGECVPRLAESSLRESLVLRSVPYPNDFDPVRDEEQRKQKSQELFDESKLQIYDQLSPEDRKKIVDIVFQYAHCFQWNDDDFSTVYGVENDIELASEDPFIIPSRPVPYNVRDFLKDHIQTLFISIYSILYSIYFYIYSIY